MPVGEPRARHLTQAFIHLDRLSHNLSLLQAQAGKALLCPVLKANAYGHDAAIVANYLTRKGCGTLCVAEVEEAVGLVDAGVRATFIVLSATLPEHAEALVAHNC